MIIHFPVQRGTTREHRTPEDDPSHFGGYLTRRSV